MKPVMRPYIRWVVRLSHIDMELLPPPEGLELAVLADVMQAALASLEVLAAVPQAALASPEDFLAVPQAAALSAVLKAPTLLPIIIGMRIISSIIQMITPKMRPPTKLTMIPALNQNFFFCTSFKKKICVSGFFLTLFPIVGGNSHDQRKRMEFH